jgi:hypothetical protein
MGSIAMDLKHLSDKIDSLQKDLYELKGQVTALTTIVGVYQKQAATVEGRLWGALIMSIGALASALFSLWGKH